MKYKTRKSKTRTKTKTRKKIIHKKNNKKTQIQIAGAFDITPTGDIISEQFLGMTIDNQYVEIRPYQLNTSVLQFLCDEKSIRIEKNQVFIENNPNLIVKMSQIKKGKNDKQNTSLSKPKKLEKTNKFQLVYESPEIKEQTFIRDNNLFIPVRISSNNQPAYIINNIDYALELLDFVNKKKDKFNNLQYPEFNIDFDFGDMIKIIGFPDPKHMTPMLSQPKFMEAYFKTISEEQKKKYHKWLIGLYNQSQSDENKISNSNTNPELYKLFDEDLEKLKEKYLSDFIPDDKKQQDEIIKKYQTNLNNILKNEKPMLRPNIKLRYMFFILQRKRTSENQTGYSKYDFMIKNIKEIGPEHTDILKKVLELIQTEIAKRFNILQPEDKGIYSNFYSSCEYGDLFHIEVDYLHPLTRLDTFSYLYKKRMTLEELIFASTNIVAEKPFLQQVKLEYQNKSYNVDKSKPFNVEDVNSGVDVGSDGEVDVGLNKTPNQTGGLIYDIDLKSQPVNIITCNHIQSFDFEIYYEKGGKYYYLVLTSSIKHLIFTQLSKNGLIKNLRELLLAENNGKKIHSYKDGKINTFLFNYNIKHIYTVKEHREVDTNIFYRNWSLPTIRHTKIYNYPFIEQIPKIPTDLLKEAESIILRLAKNNNSDFIEKKYTHTTYGNIIFVIIKVGDFICLTIKKTDNTENNFNTIWIYNNDVQKPRLKNITDLTDSTLLPRLVKILEDKKIYESIKYKLYTHIFSFYSLNSFHLKVFPLNQYQSPSYKEQISQNTELRSFNISHIINFMNIDNEYYNKLLKSGNLVFFSKYLLQFIPFDI